MKISDAKDAAEDFDKLMNMLSIREIELLAYASLIGSSELYKELNKLGELNKSLASHHAEFQIKLLKPLTKSVNPSLLKSPFDRI